MTGDKSDDALETAADHHLLSPKHSQMDVLVLTPCLPTLLMVLQLSLLVLLSTCLTILA
jgi:hypothetical protein